ncbi:peptidase [Streptococcus oralis subsp. dentisani]|uniref:Peptidase n=1 Tax=Streptococcus oralis subsp. dentisani TaxID=1458253 RepID=A0A2I1UEM9_STROR|nr:SEC10/PgrA surface exclusion domain-containing protein [Streptococcus oralis]MDU3978207.1 SEC10/PgrA surface exclusion domain-containing protein [Staphylococcus epidermidis]MDU3982107.1 SEC10/PgrA surface exclusion domain-containing protein [Streptococcus mitis]PLA04328.1 peptidase [Streptococcus oralis subsp. dentisani]
MKKTVQLTVGGAAVIGFGLASTIGHADETPVVTAPTELQSFTSEASGIIVTQEQVKDAKNKLDTSTQAVDEAQAKKDRAQSEKDEAQSEKDNAQSEVDKAQAVKDKSTPENIQKQKQEVVNAEAAKYKAEKQEKNTKNDLDKAEQVAQDQEKVVKKSEDNVASAEKEVKDAQTSVDNAQAILDGTGQAEVIAEKENAEWEQKQAQNKVQEKSDELLQAKSHDDQLQQKIVEAQKQVENSHSLVLTTNIALDKASETANQTQSALKQAQSDFSDAEARYNSINTLQISDSYVEALKSYVNNPYNILEQETLWDKHNAAQLRKLEQVNQENVELNKFKSNKKDQQISVDPNHLTKEQQMEFAFFANDLLNQVRQRFGTTKTVVSQGMLEVAKKVTDGYVSDNWKFGAGHDKKVINDVAREYGLPSSKNNSSQYLENMYGVNSSDEIHTMDDAKRFIYKSIVKFLFNGMEWQHAESITGLSKTSSGNKDYFGLSLSKREGVTSSHWLTVADTKVSGTKLDKTELSNPNSAETLTKAYHAAVGALSLAQKNNLNAQTALEQAQAEYDTALSTEEQVKEEFSRLKATPLRAPSAQVELDQAEKVQMKAQQRVVAAQKALDALTADVKTKQKNLAEAKEVLSTKQKALMEATENLAAEQTKLVTLQEFAQTAAENLQLSKDNVKKAGKELEQVKADLDALLNAEPNLVKAKKILTQRETTLNQKVTTLKEVQANLDKLLQEQKINQEAYDKLFALYSEQVEAKRLADLEAQKQAILTAGETPLEVYDETGKLVSYVAQTKAVNTQLPISYNYTWNKKQETSLPNTGTAASMLPVWGMILGLLSLAGLRKSKEN